MTDGEKDLLEVLGDERTREILKESMNEPMSADELSEACGISPQSVYRRTDRLTSCGLLRTEMEVDSDGHHFKTYRADPTQVIIDITEKEVEVTVARKDRMADRLTEFVNQVRDL